MTKEGCHSEPFAAAILSPSHLVILSIAKNLMVLRTGSAKNLIQLRVNPMTEGSPLSELSRESNLSHQGREIIWKVMRKTLNSYEKLLHSFRLWLGLSEGSPKRIEFEIR